MSAGRADLVPETFRTWVSRLPADGGPSGADWARRLPRLVGELLEEWGLEPTGVGMTGWTAVVVPVARDGEPLMLKVCWPHPEARDEHLALRRWDGHGSVRLMAADPARGALLLEPLDAARDLRPLWIDEACEIVGGLLARLHVPALPQLRTLSAFAAQQLERLQASPDALPRRLVDRTAGLVRELTAEPDCDATLLHTDLHYENVLAGEREPWLAIDPKPMAGHPGFEIQPLLRNRAEELGTDSSFRYLVRRRLEIACEAAGIDEDAARRWTYVNTAFEALWAAEGDDADDADGVTLSIALLKALDD